MEGQYEKAYGLADKVLSHLSGGEEMKPYRCIWEHEAAVAAFLTWKQTSNELFRTHAVNRLNEAAKGSFGIQWLSDLAARLGGQISSQLPGIPVPSWFSPIDELLEELGLKGSQFDRAVAEKREFITATDAETFHQGLAFLGRMVGAKSYQWKGNAKPDGFWQFEYVKAFVFEAKTAEFVDGSIGSNTVRQALTHEKCVRDERLIPGFSPCYTIVISPRTTIQADAKSYAKDLYYCSHADLISLFNKAAAALTELRIRAPNFKQDLLMTEAEGIYRKHHVFSDAVVDLLLNKHLRELPVPTPEARHKGKNT